MNHMVHKDEGIKMIEHLVIWQNKNINFDIFDRLVIVYSFEKGWTDLPKIRVQYIV